ncbi:MAG: flagellin, partial [Oscillospiraceae bacterium]
GINQGVKNAQDGISMVQTFEGALTETDSILQRMKTLATQSANGTYQDDVDREAIQLEFNQLNDELDQIADTDFNGVVALNGGVMADGLTQVDGKFDYSLFDSQMAAKDAQALADAQEAAQAAIDAAQAAYDKASIDFNATNYDLSSNGTANEWHTVDNNAYNKAAADQLWDDLGLTDSDATRVDVTFVYDEATGWSVQSAKSNASNQTTYGDVTTAAGTGISSIAADNTHANASGLGGFSFEAGGVTIDAVADVSNAKSGDTITLSFTNETPETKAPTNVRAEADSAEITGAVTDKAVVEPGAALEDIDMNAAVYAALKALDGASVTATFEDDAATTATGIKIGIVDANVTAAGGVITLKDADGNTLKDADGNDVKVFTKMDTNGKLTISTVQADGTSEGKAIATIDFGKTAQASDEGTSTVKLAIEHYAYTEGDGAYTVVAGDDKALGTSTDAKANLDAAKAALDAAKAAYPKTLADLPESNDVSKSNSNDAATAPLTYSDHVVLQVGARTKDSVDFTFKYQSNGLGGLKANLDCSSRADGLGTKDLSLLTQQDANAAIDKIDNAINKVSMVRGTFGAVQNRLEHKIDNLNTTSENLTSAESRIRDTNMAEEMMNFTKNQILSQASQSMLAQANQLPQGVLSLLQ